MSAGSGCGGDEPSQPSGSQSAATATVTPSETPTVTDESSSPINVIGDALERAGYDTAPAAGTLPDGATARIELRKGELETDLQNSFVTVFSTPQQADRAAGEAAEPGVDVIARERVVVKVTEGSGDDADAILIAAGL